MGKRAFPYRKPTAYRTLLCFTTLACDISWPMIFSSALPTAETTGVVFTLTSSKYVVWLEEVFFAGSNRDNSHLQDLRP